METFSGDTEEGTEDISGTRKSKIKFLRSRLFGKCKRPDEEFDTKHSQSASDIYAGKALGSDEHIACPQGMMGSRALSHDSIFWADQVLTDEEPMRVLSQENVHSKIKALQMKLQQQKMHLGPPPLILPVRQQDNVGGHSEDSVSSLKLPEISAAGDVPTHGLLSKAISQPISCSLPPIFKPSAAKSRPTTPSPTFTLPTSTDTPSCESPLDFTSSVQYIPCLDTSAARHRMSVKPRNQRASTKRRVLDPGCKADNLNNHTVPATDLGPKEEALERRQDVTNVSITSPKSSKLDPLSEAAPTSCTVSDLALPGRLSPVCSRVLQVKLQRHGVGTSIQRPHSSLEMKGTTGDSEFPVKTHDNSYILRKTEPSDLKNVPTSCGSVVSKSSPVCHPDHCEADSIRGIKRPGSGSFHFAITSAKSRTEDRPRSGSFAGGSRHKVGADAIAPSSLEEQKVPQPKERPFTMGRLRQEQKSSVLRWERQNSLKNVESETGSKTISPSEAVEAKEEVLEEERKTVFGFKLRSTSNSMRFWSDGSSRCHSKPSEEKSEGPKRQESSDNTVNIGRNTTTGDSPLTDPALTSNAPALPTETQTTSSNLSLEPQSAPQSTSPEVSWVSLAMEKTRSLQQLFSRRFPKDFSGGQSTTCPQTSTQLPNPGEVVNGKQVKSHIVGLQESVKPVQVESTTGATEQSKTTIKSWTEPEVPQAQCFPHVVSHQSVLTNQYASQSPSHASPQSEIPSSCGPVTPSLVQSGPSSRSYRGLQPIPTLPKSTTSAQTGAVTSPAVDEEQREFLEKESPSLLGKRGGWAGSVSEKAAFLERRAEWTAGAKGADPLRKPQMEASKTSDTQSPTSVPLEEKWMRKNLASSLSPSSSPILPPTMRSTPDGDQPSWMELAKRKSMAWSDKTMD
uniref:capping protein-inhibiting regulator of actin dynamics isoform X2 n=1 Tax=Doryrhamphus excisus TaxID=161450 RepID=UPI0025AE30DD|nr:capping protein-inhibiting regulator of actin dynamics isoform X2 [Doryrhamphus excisus]